MALVPILDGQPVIVDRVVIRDRLPDIRGLASDESVDETVCGERSRESDEE